MRSNTVIALAVIIGRIGGAPGAMAANVVTSVVDAAPASVAAVATGVHEGEAGTVVTMSRPKFVATTRSGSGGLA